MLDRGAVNDRVSKLHTPKADSPSHDDADTERLVASISSGTLNVPYLRPYLGRRHVTPFTAVFLTPPTSAPSPSSFLSDNGSSAPRKISNSGLTSLGDSVLINYQQPAASSVEQGRKPCDYTEMALRSPWFPDLVSAKSLSTTWPFWRRADPGVHLVPFLISNLYTIHKTHQQPYTQPTLLSTLLEPHARLPLQDCRLLL